MTYDDEDEFGLVFFGVMLIVIFVLLLEV